MPPDELVATRGIVLPPNPAPFPATLLTYMRTKRKWVVKALVVFFSIAYVCAWVIEPNVDRTNPCVYDMFSSTLCYTE